MAGASSVGWFMLLRAAFMTAAGRDLAPTISPGRHGFKGALSSVCKIHPRYGMSSDTEYFMAYIPNPNEGARRIRHFAYSGNLVG
jgi:hypothetical protein